MSEIQQLKPTRHDRERSEWDAKMTAATDRMYRSFLIPASVLKEGKQGSRYEVNVR